MVDEAVAIDRQRATEACHVLNYLVADLVTGARAYELFQADEIQDRIGLSTKAALNRMALNHLVLALYKFDEFYKSYKAVVPEDCRADCLAVVREIDRRKVAQLRHEFVGHTRSRSKKRPLTDEELSVYLECATGGDFLTFVRWVNDGRNEFPATVVSIVERTRDRISTTYSIREPRQ